MSNSEILKILKSFKERCSEKYGIISLGLFGSAAKGQGNPESDIDIVLKLKKQDLFSMIGIKQDLEEVIHSKVDVISYREKMNPFLKNRIDKEAIYV